MINYKKHSGFTILELIVVVVIMGLALAIIIPSYGRFSESSSLEAEADKLASFLRLAGNLAVGAKTPVRLVFDSDKNVLRAYYVSPRGLLEKIDGEIDDEFRLGRGFSMALISEGKKLKQLEFSALGVPKQPVIITIENESGQNTYIRINPITGEIIK